MFRIQHNWITKIPFVLSIRNERLQSDYNIGLIQKWTQIHESFIIHSVEGFLLHQSEDPILRLRKLCER